MEAILIPAGNRTRAGAENEFCQARFPGCPFVPWPGAHRVPSSRRAYWVEFDVPDFSHRRLNPQGDGPESQVAVGSDVVTEESSPVLSLSRLDPGRSGHR